MKRRFTTFLNIFILIGHLSCTTESNSNPASANLAPPVNMTSNSVNTENITPSSTLPAKADTAYFIVTKAAKNLEQNTIRIEKSGTYSLGSFSFNIHDSPTKEEFYDFEIKRNGRSIFKTEAFDISKVVIDKSMAGFTIFDMVTEDNSNVGHAYILDTVKAEIKSYPEPLQNTTNPIFIGNRVYLTSGLAILETDKNLRKVSERSIFYSSAEAEDKYEYMDTYNINELSRKGSTLFIYFTPHRSKKDIKMFSGEIGKLADVILLKE
jgi:hypothetical protein